jgi:hypothetical protein
VRLVIDIAYLGHSVARSLHAHVGRFVEVGCSESYRPANDALT